MSVALFGGTFNPIHFGHLKLATELAELLQVQRMRILPCAIPPHRELPDASAEQRLAMLNLAIDQESVLESDDLELRRATPSYSIETVRLVRQEIGDQVPLFLCLGMDSLTNLDSWHHWQKLLDYCHIVVCPRPGWEIPTQGQLASWISQFQCDDLSLLNKTPAGQLYICDLSMLELSSSKIRASIKQGVNIDNMTPEPVVKYIKLHSLYE